MPLELKNTPPYYNVATGSPSGAYKSYVAILEQSGTDAPTAQVLENTLDIDVTWARVGAGAYNLTADSALFTSNKTYLYCQQPSSGGVDRATRVLWGSSTIVQIQTTIVSSGVPTSDNVLDRTTFEIRVYP